MKKQSLTTQLDLRRYEEIDDYRRTAPELLNTTGAARFLGIRETALVDNLERLKIPHRQIGKTLISSRDNLVDWVKNN